MTDGDEATWEFRAECSIDPSGAVRLTHPDRNLLHRLGYSMKDLEDPGFWRSTTPPKDVPRSQEVLDVLTRGRVWEGRFRAQAASGEVLILHVRATPTLLNDGTVSVVVDGRDVTQIAMLEAALADRESRLRLLGLEFGIVMWSTDDALRFTSFSGSALKSLRLEEDALVGTSFYELFKTDDPAFPPIAGHSQALEGKTATYDVYWRQRAWRAWVEPLRDPLDRVVGVLGVAVDTTHLMETARTLVGQGRSVQETPDPGPFAQDGLEPITLHDLVIDPDRFEVIKRGEKISLTLTEFKLLTEFAQHPGRVLSREVLTKRVWGHEFYGDSASLTMAISRLREKIEDDPSNPAIIETVRGVGYRAVG